MKRSITRRAALRALGWLGASGFAAMLAPGPRLALAQGNLASLGPEEGVDATVKRLFAGRPIKDGASVIKLDLPLIAENGAVVPVAVEVTSPQTPQSYVKSIYIIAGQESPAAERQVQPDARHGARLCRDQPAPRREHRRAGGGRDERRHPPRRQARGQGDRRRMRRVGGA
jgi:predicted secreted protein